MGTINKSNSTIGTDIAGYPYCTQFFSLTSQTSPVINGKVKLRTNNGEIRKGRASGYNFPGNRAGLTGANSAVLFDTLDSKALSRANSKCGERLRSELASKGNLAVALAQIHKSRDNIITHANGLAALAARDLERLERLYPGFDPSERWARARGTRRARRRSSRAERMANTASSKYLEAVFGWLPLIDEFNTQAENLKSVPPYRSTVRVSGSELASNSYYSTWFQTSYKTEQRVRVRYRATITVDNPMQYLQSKSGITNYAGAVFDIIPWSFLISMFSNISHVLAQLSPISGISVTDSCRTQQITTIRQESKWNSEGKTALSNASGYRKIIDASVPPVSFRLRTPQLNAGLAAIGISLVTQKLTRISRAIL